MKMMTLQLLGVLLIVEMAIAISGDIFFSNENVNLFANDDGLGWTVNNKNGKSGLSGQISVGQNVPSEKCSSDAIFCRQDPTKKVEIKMADSCIHITTESDISTDELKDCVNLGTSNWFGGPEQWNQLWPIEKLEFSDYSYVTKPNDNMAVLERYWLSSGGFYLYVDSTVPLFIDQRSSVDNSLCFIARNSPPYQSRDTVLLEYSVCGLAQSDAKGAHYDAIENFLGKPTGVPDERMVRHPIWSTWARYKSEISQETVLKFANEILDNGFNNSQLEIDDKWETCYGSLTVDTSASKFPSMRDMNAELKDLGFRVTLWIHPFINNDCEPFHSLAETSDYLIRDLDGDVGMGWWNGQGSHVDFTKPAAAAWWTSRLNLLVDNELVDSFKFDAGESGWAPQLPALNASVEDRPGALTVDYVETCAQFGKYIEVRAGYKTQHLPVFVRMIDKDSRWGYNNGLKTLVTTMLQMNLVGYPFVLPDMIGGNGYGELPTKELFIRWLQANTFMPSLQFSFVPWDFDQETIDISKKFTLLHDQYADTIMSLAEKAVEDGSPINPPIWWADPDDTIASAIDDEYLLGENILVAPVLEEGATTRDVYLTRGTWLDANTLQTINGPIWIREYDAPLDILPYFIKLS